MTGHQKVKIALKYFKKQEDGTTYRAIGLQDTFVRERLPVSFYMVSI